MGFEKVVGLGSCKKEDEVSWRCAWNIWLMENIPGHVETGVRAAASPIWSLSFLYKLWNEYASRSTQVLLEGLAKGGSCCLEERRRTEVRRLNARLARIDRFVRFKIYLRAKRLREWGFTPRGVLFWDKMRRDGFRSSIRKLGFERFHVSSMESSNIFNFLLNLSMPWG